MTDATDPTNWTEREAERQRSAIASFPFPLVETTGEKALDTWQTLRVNGALYPVVIGGAAAVARLMESADIKGGMSPEAARAILDKAAKLRHPQDLTEHRRRELPSGPGATGTGPNSWVSGQKSWTSASRAGQRPAMSP